MPDSDNKIYLILEIDLADNTLNQETIKVYKHFYNACNYLLDRHCYKVEDLSPKDLRHKYVFLTAYKKFIMLIYNLEYMKL